MVVVGTLPRPLGKILLVAAVLGGAWLLTDRYAYESVVIPTGSMEPAILPHERVLLCRLCPTIHRFDVVVIESGRFGVRIAKRVIGLPGERVRLEDSWRVFINNTSLAYSDEGANHQRLEAGHHLIQIQPGRSAPFETRFGTRDLQLGPDEYYVLGDNRLASDDSRSIGPVQRREIQGVLTTIWWSYGRRDHRLR